MYTPPQYLIFQPLPHAEPQGEIPLAVDAPEMQRAPWGLEPSAEFGLFGTVHLNELREFHALGRAIASRLVDRPRVDDDADGTTSAAANGGPPPATTMKLGYHALPSFEPLHLHIISSDFDSTCVTKRKHITSRWRCMCVIYSLLMRFSKRGHFDGVGGI